MLPIKILINLGLLCWSTIHLGLKKGWVSRKDVTDYAVDLLINGNENENVAIIAGGDSLDDDEFFTLVSNHVRQPDDKASSLDKWRLAHLLNIAESDDNEQTKLDRLQEVYANFDYPEDMASCSIYSQDEIDPLVAMMQVIEELRSRLT
ncbi:hypothetical protein VINI7043_21066 [Vibrio nigripulchritudo ATCC 27043]|uniref:DUF2247 family protein n=1 Tax=Vibrio nigripulchritudo TaxID=28173 RepID=UPI00021C230E|nr:DUF2247 family protein [Vibrio nigripulchritudo]EGU56401.1 hypothetical protein VINI7043_21066 [Vibrio nigripulchritudo ATCC 27043]